MEQLKFSCGHKLKVNYKIFIRFPSPASMNTNRLSLERKEKSLDSFDKTACPRYDIYETIALKEKPYLWDVSLGMELGH